MGLQLAEFERAVLADIPLARAMALRAAAHDGKRLTLHAPLAMNRNDKGCAFGGSLVSLMTLAGWGLIVLHLESLQRECEVYVQDSQVRYLAPVWQDLEAQAELAAGEDWQAFDTALAERGRARIAVQARVVLPGAVDACTLQARFVAIDKVRQNAATRDGVDP